MILRAALKRVFIQRTLIEIRLNNVLRHYKLPVKVGLREAFRRYGRIMFL